MSKKILLKKYANRRLYDTERSTCITLRQVADLIREGHRVEVIDAKTDEDVTVFILSQILAEKAKARNALLPTPLLHLIIQHGESVLSEFFDKYLELIIRSYLNTRKALDEEFRNWLQMSRNPSSPAQQKEDPLDSLDSLLELFSRSLTKEQKDE